MAALDFGETGTATAWSALEPEGAGTRVPWGLMADIGMNPAGRRIGPMTDRWVGADDERGLASPKVPVEAGRAPPRSLREEPSGAFGLCSSLIWRISPGMRSNFRARGAPAPSKRGQGARYANAIDRADAGHGAAEGEDRGAGGGIEFHAAGHARAPGMGAGDGPRGWAPGMERDGGDEEGKEAPDDSRGAAGLPIPGRFIRP